jgi:hypothetical protein
MHYLQEDVPRKEINLISQVGDLSLRVDLNLLESLEGYVGGVEKKGTTRSNVDPKLRKRRDLKNLLLHKKRPPRKKEGMCTWLLQAHMQIRRHG